MSRITKQDLTLTQLSEILRNDNLIQSPQTWVNDKITARSKVCTNFYNGDLIWPDKARLKNPPQVKA